MTAANNIGPPTPGSEWAEITRRQRARTLVSARGGQERDAVRLKVMVTSALVRIVPRKTFTIGTP